MKKVPNFPTVVSSLDFYGLGIIVVNTAPWPIFFENSPVVYPANTCDCRLRGDYKTVRVDSSPTKILRSSASSNTYSTSTNCKGPLVCVEHVLSDKELRQCSVFPTEGFCVQGRKFVDLDAS